MPRGVVRGECKWKYGLNNRNGKRTAQAALKIACDLVDEGMRTEEEAVALFYKRTAATGKLTFPVEEERKDENKKVKRRRMNERFAEWDAF